MIVELSCPNVLRAAASRLGYLGALAETTLSSVVSYVNFSLIGMYLNTHDAGWIQISKLLWVLQKCWAFHAHDHRILALGGLAVAAGGTLFVGIRAFGKIFLGWRFIPD